MTCASEYAAHLRARGFRMTSQRLAILHVLRHAGTHLSPREVYTQAKQELPTLTEPTVYRTLELLERLGLVWHTHLGKGAPVYHAAEHPHLHVVCQECGEISSVDPTLLDAAAERLAADLGFTVDVGHVALSGTCRACAEKSRTEHP